MILNIQILFVTICIILSAIEFYSFAIIIMCFIDSCVKACALTLALNTKLEPISRHLVIVDHHHKPNRPNHNELQTPLGFLQPDTKNGVNTQVN